MRIIYEFEGDEEAYERACFERGSQFHRALGELYRYLRDVEREIDEIGCAEVDVEDVIAEMMEIIDVSGAREV